MKAFKVGSLFLLKLLFYIVLKKGVDLIVMCLLPQQVERCTYKHYTFFTPKLNVITFIKMIHCMKIMYIS